MANGKFILENFRPWNPQPQELPLRRPSATCGYPSPVSLHSSLSPFLSPHAHLDGPTARVTGRGRHPLPARPPEEVCLHGGPESARRTVQQPATADPISPGSHELSGFEMGDFMLLQPQSPGRIHDECFDCSPISSHPRNDFDAELDEPLSYGQKPPNLTEGNIPICMEDPPSDFAIDPMILEDRRVEVEEGSDVSEESRGRASPPPFPSADSPGAAAMDSERPDNPRHATPLAASVRRPAETAKVSVIIDNREKRRTPGRISRKKGNQIPSPSPSIAYFSALPADEKLFFLSWLFEGAMSRCIPAVNAMDATPIGKTSQDAGMDSPAPDTDGADGAGQESGHSRRGQDWSAAEDRLLVRLRETENLAWSAVIERFSQTFPGRSPGSVKVHWYTKLSR